MKRIALHLLLPILLMVFNTSTAQIDSVRYQIRYNPSTTHYDCYLIVSQGSGTTLPQRTQSSAQFSFVVPTGITADVVTRYMPKKIQSPFTPCNWSVSNILVAPSIDSTHDFYAVSPELSPTSAYTNLNLGDTIKIFSLLIDPLPACKGDVRLFDGATDPNSNALGGADFSQGFTVLLPQNQMYPGLQYPVMPSIIVSNTSDSGDGSLRTAIGCASEGSTIHFAASLATDTIGLNQKIVINKNISLNASITTQFNIKSLYNGPLFEIASGKNVTFQKLKLKAKPNNLLVNRILLNNGILNLKNVLLVDPNIGSAGNTLTNKGQLTIQQNSQLRKN